MCLSSDNIKRLLMYYNAMTMIAMIGARCDQRARHVHTVSATSTCQREVWKIDVEPFRTRFHCSMIFHKYG
jgi:hypothetical protein